MPTTCEYAEYIVENALDGINNSTVCKNVLKKSWALTRHFRDQADMNTTDNFLYQEYVEGEEEQVERTKWLVNWLFDQSSFPNKLPERWAINPIIDRNLNLPDSMMGLRKAASLFVEKNCGTTS